jgi:opacity protein-like surface antigen
MRRLMDIVRRTARIIPLWILIMLFLSAWAFAQDGPPRLEFVVEGGASLLNGGTAHVPAICPDQICPGCTPCPPLTGTSSFSKTVRIVTGAGYRFTHHDALEASFSYSPNHLSLQEGTESLGSAYSHVDLLSFNYVRYLTVKSRVQPFATAGLGLNRFSGPSTASAVYYGYVNADNGWQFAWSYGAGADVVLERQVALRLELRDYVTGQPSIVTGTSHNLVPSIGLVFRFK